VQPIRGSHPRKAARKSRRKPSYSSESRGEGRKFVRYLEAMLIHSQGLARRLLSPARGSEDLSPTRGRATLGGMARSYSARPTAPSWACRAAGSV
jgi:hypothetical protein